MIIYSEDYDGGLDQYGILIPIRDSKFRRTFAELRAHPVLGPLQSEWHLEHAGQSIFCPAMSGGASRLCPQSGQLNRMSDMRLPPGHVPSSMVQHDVIRTLDSVRSERPPP